MSLHFSEMLRGLMDNRRLSANAISQASGLTESTIDQLLDGRIPPQAEILQDIAPVLQMSSADLLSIAGISTAPAFDHRRQYPAASEIRRLTSAASFLTPGQVGRLVDLARDLRDSTSGND